MLDDTAGGLFVRNGQGRQVYISARGTKRKVELHRCGLRIRAAGLQPVEAAYVTMLHVRDSKRTNPDNFIAGAKKVILDALQKTGVLANDGWAQMLGFADYWQIGGKGILVVLDDERVLTADECRAELENKRGRQKAG